MKQTFSEQLNMWRTKNGVSTMQEVLKNNTTKVSSDGVNVSIIRPHACIKSSDIKFLGAYIKHKLELMRLVEKMEKLVKEGKLDEAARAKGGIRKITKRFFDTVRESTGYENVMGIDHSVALSLEDGEKTLTIHLFPLKADGRQYNFKVINFKNNDTDEEMKLPCIVLDESKKRKKRKKRKKVSSQ